MSPAAASDRHTAASASPATLGKRWWFELHSWVGLKLSLLMLFVSLTGTLATLAHEIDWLLHPQMRVAPQEQRASWGDWLASARTAYPDWELNFIAAPVDPWFAAKISARTPEGRNRFIWVDPYTARVQGDTHWFNVHRFLRNTHRHLMMPVSIGVPIVCVLALTMLVTLASSLVIYRRWWKGFFKWPRGERPRRFWGDVHRLAGVWSLWFVALIALTGVFYLVESLGGNAAALPERRIAATPAQSMDGAAAVAGEAAQLDAMIEHAQQRLPELQVRAVALSDAPDDPVRVQGQASAWLVRDRANVVAFDPVSGAPVWQRRGEDLGAYQRVSESADPLHFGTWGGLPTKLAWFVFGALLTLLSATGVYLYGMRASESLRALQRRTARGESTPSRMRAGA